jgi:hypothetical protein
MGKSQREASRNEMSSKGIFSSSAYVVIEAGNAGWGGYYSALLWVDELGNGQMITDMSKERWGHRVERTFAASDLMELMKSVATGRSIAGMANPEVADGLCYFVTLKHGSNAVQFAAYAPGKGKRLDESEAIIDQVHRFIDRHASF